MLVNNEPLRAIINSGVLVGGEWPHRARQAATAIARVGIDMSIGTKLLADIKDIFAIRAVDRLPSLDLVEALGEIEGHPWADWKGGQLITRNALAHLLEPFGIRPGSIRLEDNRVLRGYPLSHFQDAFERYLSPSLLPQEAISNR